MGSYNKDVYFDDFGQICRICLLSDTSLQLIPQKLWDIFKNITDIESRKDDELPQNVCQKCVKQLEEIGAFIEKCKDHHSLLLLALQRKSEVFILADIPDDSCVSENEFDFSIQSIKTEDNSTDITNATDPIQDSTKLTCAECGSKFSHKKYLLRHITWHCKALKYSCGLCSLKCKSEKALQRHSAIHGVSKIFTCYICSEEFATGILRYEHQRTKHNVNSKNCGSKFSCSKCDRVLTSVGSLKNHMRTHTGEKPFTCKHCDKTFAYPNSLNIHIRSHTGERPFICNICKKGYKSSTSLKKHKEKAHYEINFDTDSCNENEDEKPKERNKGEKVECKVCHKMLYKHGFGTHMRAHSMAKKEFICGVCKKQFQKNSHLERHMRIHTGERPYTCPHCGKSFMQDNDLKRHVSRHTDDKKFQCQHCGKRYYSKSALGVHVAAHALVQKPPKPPCEACAPHATACRHRAVKAAKTHLCTVCGKAFTSRSSLVVHTRLHTGDAPFACPSCDKKYVTSTALKKHVIRNHTGERLHVCMICQKSYYDSFSLKRHLDRVHAILDAKSEKEEDESVN
ncbi:unnamed protein product [Phaedon cochleariae]|uniref:Zinc finger protein n=1 Tax=Phaedon cochleariae TaxID=80249 RepID=A0A9P0DWS7_PHACE|nr:unnamed protein product [Phaedon cochleariae]